MSNHARQPAGSPKGGQFASTGRAESDADLGNTVTGLKMRRWDAPPSEQVKMVTQALDDTGLEGDFDLVSSPAGWTYMHVETANGNTVPIILTRDGSTVIGSTTLDRPTPRSVRAGVRQFIVDDRTQRNFVSSLADVHNETSPAPVTASTHVTYARSNSLLLTAGLTELDVHFDENSQPRISSAYVRGEPAEVTWATAAQRWGVGPSKQIPRRGDRFRALLSQAHRDAHQDPDVLALSED